MIRHEARLAAPVFVREQLPYLLIHGVVDRRHGPGGPVREVLGAVLDGAGDPVADAEASGLSVERFGCRAT